MISCTTTSSCLKERNFTLNEINRLIVQPHQSQYDSNREEDRGIQKGTIHPYKHTYLARNIKLRQHRLCSFQDAVNVFVRFPERMCAHLKKINQKEKTKSFSHRPSVHPVKETARRRRRRRRRKIVLGRHSLLQKIISLHKKITRSRGRRTRTLINQQEDSDSEICRRRESVSHTYADYFSESYLPARWALSKSGSKP